jgi:NifU-like protein involved in Fe-S cluster formation
MSEFSSLVQEYYKNPINNYRMEDATISQHEGNAICGDDITVYLKLQSPEGASQPVGIQSVVAAWSYDGNVSMITQAAASFFSELVVWHTFTEILSRNEALMIENGFEVSHRRRRARVIALVATRNAIHALLKDGKQDGFDDVLWN